jgi:hypothetical protein
MDERPDVDRAIHHRPADRPASQSPTPKATCHQHLFDHLIAR